MSKQIKDEEIVVREKKPSDKISVEMPKEYWAANSPYVDAYIRALNYANMGTSAETDDTAYYEDAAAPEASAAAPAPSGKKGKKAKKPKEKKVYKKRSFVLVLFAIVMLAAVVVAGLGVIGPVGQYLAPYMHTNPDYNPDQEGSLAAVPASFVDPIYSFFKGLFGTAETEEDAGAKAAAATEEPAAEDAGTEGENVVSFTDYYLQDKLSQYKDFKFDGAKSNEVIDVVVAYAFPFVVILFLVGCVFLFIKAIVAAASKKKGKKFKLGYGWFLTFLFLIGTVIMGLVWNGLGINEIKSYFMYSIGSVFGLEEFNVSASVVSMGLGMWIEIVLMIVALVLLCFSYKRLKKPVKKAQNPAKKA